MCTLHAFTWRRRRNGKTWVSSIYRWTPSAEEQVYGIGPRIRERISGCVRGHRACLSVCCVHEWVYIIRIAYACTGVYNAYARARWLLLRKVVWKQRGVAINARRVSSANPMQYFTWAPYDVINKVIIGATQGQVLYIYIHEHKAGELIHPSVNEKWERRNRSGLLFKGIPHPRHINPMRMHVSTSTCKRDRRHRSKYLAAKNFYPPRERRAKLSCIEGYFSIALYV